MTLYCSFCARLNFLHNVYYLIFNNRTKVFDYVLTFGWKIVVFRSPSVRVAIHARDLLSLFVDSKIP